MTAEIRSIEDLERLVASLYRSMGHDIKAVQYIGTDIADLHVTSSGGKSWLVRSVRSPEISPAASEQLLHNLNRAEFDQIAVITNGTISPEFRSLAKRQSILTVDGATLFKYLSRAGVISPPQPVPHPQYRPSQQENPTPPISSPTRTLPPRAVLLLIALATGVAAICACFLVPQLLRGSAPSSQTTQPTCDLAAAARFNERVIEVESPMVEGLSILVNQPQAVPSEQISASLGLAKEWLDLLENSNIPDCYRTILADSLALTTTAANHYVDAYQAAIDLDNSATEREFTSGIDASNLAGESFMDVICQYELSDVDATLARACRNWLSQ